MLLRGYSSSSYNSPSTTTMPSTNSSKPVDYFRPLQVDVSVEYELPKEVAPPPGSAPLLIIHPAATTTTTTPTPYNNLSNHIHSPYHLRSSNTFHEKKTLCTTKNCTTCKSNYSSAISMEIDPQKTPSKRLRTTNNIHQSYNIFSEPLNLAVNNNNLFLGANLTYNNYPSSRNTGPLYSRRGNSKIINTGIIQMISNVHNNRTDAGGGSSSSSSGVSSENEVTMSDDVSPEQHYRNLFGSSSGIIHSAGTTTNNPPSSYHHHYSPPPPPSISSSSSASNNCCHCCPIIISNNNSSSSSSSNFIQNKSNKSRSSSRKAITQQTAVTSKDISPAMMVPMDASPYHNNRSNNNKWFQNAAISNPGDFHGRRWFQV